MKYIPPKKLKVLMFLFFGTGIWGIVAGTFIIKHPAVFYIVVFGVINLCLGGFCGYKFLTQEPESEKRKK